ncbi:hypothetical protein XS74_25035 [Salmonella enterica subsp. enterica]|nr:hypothetical protein [Salmonella enterica subsp. enterica]
MSRLIINQTEPLKRLSINDKHLLFACCFYYARVTLATIHAEQALLNGADKSETEQHRQWLINRVISTVVLTLFICKSPPSGDVIIMNLFIAYKNGDLTPYKGSMIIIKFDNNKNWS